MIQTRRKALCIKFLAVHEASFKFKTGKVRKEEERYEKEKQASHDVYRCTGTPEAIKAQDLEQQRLLLNVFTGFDFCVTD